jgi:NADH:ubiquinone oxidoreductase subunit
MGVFKNIFTWWEGATFGTAMGTIFGGARVGEDALGNIFYEAKKAENGRKRRWVIYKGANDPSRISPEWYGWLHHQIDVLPDNLPRRTWQIEPTPNLTGTNQAYRPSGALEAGGVRARATGDYEAWSPE